MWPTPDSEDATLACLDQLHIIGQMNFQSGIVQTKCEMFLQEDEKVQAGNR